MKNLAVICIVLALLNSFMAAGYDYSNRFRGIPESDPLQSEAFVNSLLPIDSFVLPVQGTASLQHQLVKTIFHQLLFPIAGQKQRLFLSSGISRLIIPTLRQITNLSLHHSAILRI